jgi:hypothetical protein
LPTYGTATEKFIEKRFFEYVEITENKHNPKTNVKKVGGCTHCTCSKLRGTCMSSANQNRVKKFIGLLEIKREF